MSKHEFLNILKQTLAGEVPTSEIETNVRFYDDYISGAASHNKTEEEYINELGDPRLIAKTIIETYRRSNSIYNQSSYQQSYSYDDSVENDSSSNSDSGTYHYTRYTSSTLPWYKRLLFTIIPILLIFVILSFFGFAIKLFFSIGLPILLIFLLIKLITTLFR